MTAAISRSNRMTPMPIPAWWPTWNWGETTPSEFKGHVRENKLTFSFRVVLTDGFGGGAVNGLWRTWMMPLDARMSDSIMKRSLMYRVEVYSIAGDDKSYTIELYIALRHGIDYCTAYPLPLPQSVTVCHCHCLCHNYSLFLSPS